MNLRKLPEREILGPGVIWFHDAFDEADPDVLIALDRAVGESLAEHYGPPTVFNGVECVINKSGHRIPVADLAKTCIRISSLSGTTLNFARLLESVFWSLLPSYVECYPMALPCLWWETEGHYIKYAEGSELGLHADNDINFQYQKEPEQQLGAQHVLASIAYVGGSWEGGEIEFPYLGITVSPEPGDVLMFPANFVTAHQVMPVRSGERYAYLSYFGQGSPAWVMQPPRNHSDDHHGGQVWLRDLASAYRVHIQSTYGDSRGDLMLPLDRATHSAKDEQ